MTEPRPTAGEIADIERVKTMALSLGVQISRDVLDDLGGPGSLTIHEYPTTGGITLDLPHGVLVNAPFDEPFCARSPLRMGRIGGELALVLDETVVPVRHVVPLPGYLDAIDDAGRAVTDTVMSHGDRIRVSPIVGCAFDCHFCDLATIRYRPRPVEQLLAGIDVALADRALPPDHLLISGGTPGLNATQQQYFEDVCIAISQHIRQRTAGSPEPFEVDIMMSPRADADFIDRVVDAGVTGFSFNIEIFSADAAKLHMPLKQSKSRGNFESSIARAVELLGRGTGRVRSLIIVGLEPVEDTLAGVEWLAAQGCHPVLSPFRPARDIGLADLPPASAEDLSAVLTESRAIVQRHGLTLGPRCIPCQHNTLSFPWDLEGLAA